MNTSDEWTHDYIDSMNYYSDEHFFLHKRTSTYLIGWGPNHDKKWRINLRDTAYQDQLFFIQITIPKGIDKNIQPD
jgi:hypothetical protein